MLIIEPMAAIANAPLATPSAKTLALNGQPGPTMPAATSPSKASAEARQPPTAQVRRLPKGRPAKRPPAAAASSMPASAPPCCTPESEVDWPGV